MIVDGVLNGRAAASRATPVLLRRALLADAVVSGAAGIVLALGADPLEDGLGLAVGLLRGAGLVALAWAAPVTYVGTRERVARSAAWVVIGGNLVWAIASVLLLASDAVEPTGLGYAAVVGQAVVVALLADWQYVGTKRTGAPEARPTAR